MENLKTRGQFIWINGKWVKPRGGARRAILNPSTLDELSFTFDCDAADVEEAVLSASSAQRSWWRTPGPEKAHMLRHVGERLRKKRKALAETLTLETGKPLCESYDCIEWVAACFEYYSEVGRASSGLSLPPVAPHQVNFTVKEPYGVVAAIAPFNFPVLLMSWKVAPALAAGNSVVCKPPHQNPLSTLMMMETLDHLPPGVMNCVTGGAQTGDLLIRHPGVDCIAFTGSTETGRKIASLAGSMLKKVNLELGGIDPFIVFEDADLNVAVQGVAWARLLNSGQVCTSSKRIYLVQAIANEFTERLIEHVKSIRVGNPMEGSTDLGPLISKEALEKVTNQVKRSVAEGARLVLGGKPMSPNGLKGYFYEPTILTNVKHGSLPTQEEIFGPVISLITVKDSAEAIRLANDSKYGLGACVYTKSLETAMTAMENIKAGTFWINDPLTDNDAGPFGGMRWSGVGRELGEEGLNAFREPKHVHMDYIMERKSYWYPYSNREIPKD